MKALATVLSLLCLLLLPARSAETRPPNIILVMPDDIGYGDFSCLGNPIIKTPAIDAFHAQSVRFTDFHVSPTCAPSRAALLTGRHEFKNGVTHTILERDRLVPSAITLAQVLKPAGYATGIFGKWHLGDEPAYWPSKRGFDEMFIHGAGGIGQTYPGSNGDVPGNKYFDPTILHNGKFVKTQGYCTDVFFSRAIEWMDEKLDAGIPFFTVITPNVAHGPLVCPPENFAHFQGKVPDDVAKFYGMIENFDQNFAHLIAKLDEWGIANRTMVIFLTDNGGTVGVKTFNAGMRGGKTTPYQGGTRVPSFWRWPAKFAGNRDIPNLTAHLDILPTLAEIAGVTLDEATKRQVEGRSLVPLLLQPADKPAPDWPERNFFTHIGRWPRGKAIEDFKYRGCSIRNNRYTLVNNKELYDLQADPGEKKDVSAEHPDIVKALGIAYDQWWKDVQPMLVNENVTGPKVNPFKALYWEQFGGGPDEALRKAMDPAFADPDL